MIDVTAWVAAARQGEAVGRCAGHHCNGHLFCLSDERGVAPFQDHTDRETDVTIRWYEAMCNTCSAVYAYPNGRDSTDGVQERREKRDKQQGRDQRRDAQRVSEFIGALGGQS